MADEIEVIGEVESFVVIVSDGDSRTRHTVRASATELDRLAPGVAPKRILEAAFRFLLDREAKESILARFGIGEISRYFPEFERTISDYLP
jgi:hypothetical protein